VIVPISDASTEIRIGIKGAYAFGSREIYRMSDSASVRWVHLIDPFDSAIFLYMNTNPKKGDIRVAEKSAIQRIKDLDAERASIFEHAKAEALEKAKAAVAELNGLGLNYTQTNGAGKQAKAGLGKGKRTIKAAACPICEFQTTPPHDGRTHRNQKKKSPFSAAELKEKGLVKV
jgi:hypothetical protein